MFSRMTKSSLCPLNLSTSFWSISPTYCLWKTSQATLGNWQLTEKILGGTIKSYYVLVTELTALYLVWKSALNLHLSELDLLKLKLEPLSHANSNFKRSFFGDISFSWTEQFSLFTNELFLFFPFKRKFEDLSVRVN